MRLAQEDLEITERAVRGMYVGIVRDIVAIVLPRRRTEWKNPNRRNAEVLDVVELLRQTGKVAHPVIHRVVERPDVHLIDDRVFEPEGVAGNRGRLKFDWWCFVVYRRSFQHLAHPSSSNQTQLDAYSLLASAPRLVKFTGTHECTRNAAVDGKVLLT